MTTPKESAEAILIVIKKVLKWVLISVVVLSAIAFVAIAIYDYNFEKERAKRKLIEDKVKVSAYYSNSIHKCPDEYPFNYFIENTSDKKVLSVKFRVEVKRKGYSNAINSYTRIEEFKILNQSEWYVNCFTTEFKDKISKEDYGNLEFNIVMKEVEFEDVK